MFRHLALAAEFMKCSSPRLSAGDTLQDPPWVPETTGRTEPYTHCVSPVTHVRGKLHQLGTAKD